MDSMTDEERIEFARSGGNVGGDARAAALTPERRSEIARKAALASAKVRRAKAAGKKKA